MKQTLAVLTLGAVGLLLGAGVYLWLEPPAPPAQPELTLEDLDGQQHALTDYRGELVVVNFWATWCPPCMEEIPMLIEAQEALRAQGLRILGPAMDDKAAVARFVERQGMNYPVFADPAQVGPALSALGDTQGALPYTVVIDRDGKLVESHHGKLDRDEFDALIAPYL